MNRLVKVNENGRRIGEDHQRAKLTDREVDQIRDLRDAGMSYGQIAKKMDVGKTTVRDICVCRRRAHICVAVRIIQN